MHLSHFIYDRRALLTMLPVQLTDAWDRAPCTAPADAAGHVLFTPAYWTNSSNEQEFAKRTLYPGSWP